MATVLLTLLFAAAATTSDCATNVGSTASAATERCAERDRSATSSSTADATVTTVTTDSTGSSGVDRAKSTSSDDEPWTYESGSDLDSEHVCLTRGAGGICIENDD